MWRPPAEPCARPKAITQSRRTLSTSGEDQQIPDPDWSLLPSPAIAAVPDSAEARP